MWFKKKKRSDPEELEKKIPRPFPLELENTNNVEGERKADLDMVEDQLKIVSQKLDTINQRLSFLEELINKKR